jgi:hypothetical protein
VNLDERIRERLGQLLDLVTAEKVDTAQLEEVHSGLLTITIELFGSSSPQVTEMISAHADFALVRLGGHGGNLSNNFAFRQRLTGTLKSIIASVDNGLLSDIRTDAAGSVYTSFIGAAKQAVDQDQKDAAAVLGCAALEDALKRLAVAKGLDVDEKSMPDVCNALKGARAIPATQADAARSYTGLRNHAFHAEWGKVDMISVQTMISFTELFIANHF